MQKVEKPLTLQRMLEIAYERAATVGSDNPYFVRDGYLFIIDDIYSVNAGKASYCLMKDFRPSRNVWYPRVRENFSKM